MRSKPRSSPPMGQALSGKMNYTIEGIDIKNDHFPDFTETKVFWKRMNSKEEGEVVYHTRFPEVDG